MHLSVASVLLITPLLVTFHTMQEPARPDHDGKGEDSPEILGPRLLAEGKWDEAAEVYGTWTYGLLKAAPEVLERGDSDRFRFEFVNFLFRYGPAGLHASYDKLGWLGDVCEAYPKWSAGLPVEERAGVLDMSHADLLHKLVFDEETKRIPASVGEEILRALGESPESIPARLAYEAFFKWGDLPSGPDAFLLAGREVLMEGAARLTLVRLASAAEAFRYIREKQIPGEVVRDIIESGWELAPTDEERARLLYSLAEVKRKMADCGFGGETTENAREVMSRVYREFPGTLIAGHAVRNHLFSMLREQGPLVTLEEVKKLEGEALGHDVQVAEARLGIASTLLVAGGDATLAENLLRDLAQREGIDASAARAMERLAEICGRREDPAGEREWLERAFRLGASWSGAAERLAPIFEEEGRWSDALKAWTAIRVGGGCGNCMADREISRRRNIGRCLRHLGEFEAAADLYADSLMKERWQGLLIGSTGWMEEDLYDLYRDAGQVEDLRAIADQMEAKRRMRFSGSGFDVDRAARLGYLRKLIEAGGPSADEGVPELISVLTRKARHANSLDEGWVDPLCETAARALATRGDAAVYALREAHRPAAFYDSGPCIVFALGIHPSPKALEALESSARIGYSDEGKYIRTHLYGIALRGKEGKPALERLRASGLPGDRIAADLLRRLERGDPLGRSPPAPPKGSLPKKLDLH